MAFLQRTELAIQECEDHLKESASFGTSVESYLTQHILVILCAEMQQDIYRIVNDRAAKSTDICLTNFVTKTNQNLLRSVEKGNLANFVGYFGSDILKNFNALLDDKEITLYNNAVANRHHVAHHSGATVTFDELKIATKIAQKILSSMASVLA